MICSTIRHFLPGYLDGALAATEQGRVRGHLENCPDCREELQRYRKLSAAMSRVERPAPPADLALRIRMSLAQARAVEPWTRRAWSRMAITVENLLAPLAVPATGGLVTAMLVFALVFHGLLFGLPLGAVPNDVPIYTIQPARLEALAPFASPGVMVDEQRAGEHVLLVEATVDERGQAVNYQILAGPDTRTVRRQLDQVVFFSRYRPQRSFGRAQPGRVILSFSEIRVKG